ncbi:MAG TPA: enolase C-terminal domain-like protein [Gemmataceae bacterium]|nr:enolase C-terminal domain-like protein [Gemmataceae bacterium]
MAKKTGGDILIETIMDWGVDVIFGLPGDGINGIMEALRTRQDKIRFVQVRHEEAAAFMACAYAKYTGRLGACLATSGPGGVHLLNGLYDAKMDGQPVLAISGHHYHDLIDTHAQQDVDLDRVFTDVAVYSTRVMGPEHVRNVTSLACRQALSRRGVAHINFPVDFQSMTHQERSERNLPKHTSDVPAFKAGEPCKEDLNRAAEILNAGKKIVILAGRGALGATVELEQLAETLGAPIIKPLLGKASVPDDSPYTTGGIGLLGTKPSQEAIEACDTLCMVGTSFPYMEFLPKPGSAKGVQIDIDAVRIGLRYPVEVGLVGDSRRTLRALLPMLQRKDDRSFLEKAQKGMKEWNETMHERATRMDAPMKPQVVAHELGKRLPDNAIVSCDSGTIATWWARHIPVKRGQMHSISGTLATMACGLPYTIAAQVAYPDRPCIGFVGDGGFSMLMAEFVTAVKYKLPIKIVIIKNNSLGQIKWEQMVFLGNPEFGVDLQPIDFAAFARACGGTGFTIDDPKMCGQVLEQALATEGPVLVEAVVDPYEPPMPPKATLKQGYELAKSLARGEPDRGRIIATIVEDKVKEMIYAMVRIEKTEVSAYSIPTDSPESDGTFEWDKTTLVLVEISAGGQRGLGFTYADTAAAELIRGLLARIIHQRDAMANSATWIAMLQAIRNLGRPGISSMAIAAVDIALWDLKAKLLGVPLVILLGAARERVAVYGSGGFTSYSIRQLQEQLAGWAESGIQRVKMKIGREPDKDVARVQAARQAIGPDIQLFVDANGAYNRKQALAQAERFAEVGVTWFEEPVSSDDLTGLRLLRDRAPAGMDIAAGEYGYDLFYFLRMLEAGAVDTLQADATRCAGITGFLQVGAVCGAFGLPLSAHTAPAIHLHPCCALGRVCHVEYFHDHARIEQMLFDGAPVPIHGEISPDPVAPGLGLEFKRADAAPFLV